jgi:hypothetical protein
MCGKLETAGTITNSEGLLIYARVLREAGQGGKALELLGSALGARCMPMVGRCRLTVSNPR